MSKCPRGSSTLLSTGFTPWINAVDAIIGADARVALGTEYPWTIAWRTGRTPKAAVHEALDDLEARLEHGHA